MRHKNVPDKQELLKTEMKIQDQINQWMQVRREHKDSGDDEVKIPCTQTPESEPKTQIADSIEADKKERIQQLLEKFKVPKKITPSLDLK